MIQFSRRNLLLLPIYLFAFTLYIHIASLGNQEDVWHRALVTLPQGSFQVVFEGFRGTGYEGDVAIDDISIKEGICQDPG